MEGPILCHFLYFYWKYPSIKTAITPMSFEQIEKFQCLKSSTTQGLSHGIFRTHMAQVTCPETCLKVCQLLMWSYWNWMRICLGRPLLSGLSSPQSCLSSNKKPSKSQPPPPVPCHFYKQCIANRSLISIKIFCNTKLFLSLQKRNILFWVLFYSHDFMAKPKA